MRKEFGENLRDTELIAQAKRHIGFQKSFDDLLKTMPFQYHFYQLQGIPVRDMRTAENSDEVKEIGVIAVGNESFGELLDAIYAIRCNLFHGRKNPEDIYGTDYTLIFLAYNLLLPIVRYYLENKGLVKK